MGSNGSFYQNGLPLSTAETGLGNVNPGAPVANKASSSFYLSGTAYSTLANPDALMVALNAALAGTATNATSAASSAAAAAASAASVPALLSAYALKTYVDAANSLNAPLVSPALTGTPTAPTATVGTNTTQIATTAFVCANGAALSNAVPLVDANTGGSGVGALASRADHVHPTDTSRSPLVSPAFTGTPTAPTPAALNNSTQLATTAYDDAANAALASTLNTSIALRAPLASPALTGAPTAPTQAILNNSTAIATTAYVDRTTHEKLSGARTYYVLTTGSDSNTGLVNSAGGAFLTIQKAINTAYLLDLSGFAVTIQVGAGTYSGGVIFQGPLFGAGLTGSLTLLGDTTTPANVVLTGGVSAQLASITYLGGFKITTFGILARDSAILNINGKMEYGAVGTGTYHLSSYFNGAINVSAAEIISGGSAFHYLSTQCGRISAAGIAVTFVGTPTFSSIYAYASQGSSIIAVNAQTFTGSFVGQRFQVEFGAGIVTGGGGANFLPGTIAGVTNTPGWYQ